MCYTEIGMPMIDRPILNAKQNITHIYSVKKIENIILNLPTVVKHQQYCNGNEQPISWALNHWEKLLAS